MKTVIYTNASGTTKTTKVATNVRSVSYETGKLTLMHKNGVETIEGVESFHAGCYKAKQMPGVLISGFAGIGKSTLAADGRIVDLESTPFNWNWKLYANVAQHMVKNGYNVAISAHEEIRKELQSRGQDYVFVTPDVNDLGQYLTNYVNRGNSKEFISLMSNNWNVFLEATHEEENHFILESGQYLKDVFEALEEKYAI